jgi:signal transduction histidine kinase
MTQVKDIFATFSRLRSADDFQGHGIGLAISKRVIDIHGGKIWAVGGKGKGAAFYFTIPDIQTTKD